MNKIISKRAQTKLPQKVGINFIKYYNLIILINSIVTQIPNRKLQKIKLNTNTLHNYNKLKEQFPEFQLSLEEFKEKSQQAQTQLHRILSKNPTSIIFDCDGTLINTEEINDLTYRKITEDLDLSENTINRIINETRGMRFDRALPAIQEILNQEEHLTNLPLEFSELSNFRSIYRKISTQIKAEIGIQPTQGTSEFLIKNQEDLHPIPFAVATNNRRENTIQDTANLPINSDQIHSSFGGEPKPNPQVLYQALTSLPTDTKPDQTIVVEDSKTGIEAAIKGGFIPIIFNNGINQSLILDYPEILSIDNMQTLEYLIKINNLEIINKKKKKIRELML